MISTLTTSIETVTSGNFSGIQSATNGAINASSTLNAGDTLIGTLANSTANLTFANTTGNTGAAVGVRFDNVKTINATAVGGAASSLDLSLATGLTGLGFTSSSASSAMSFLGTQTLVPVTITSNAAAFTATFLDSLVTPATSTATLNLNGAINGTSGIAGTLSGVTASVGFNTISITGTGAASRLSSLTNSTDNDLRVLNISGAGNVRIDDVDAGVAASNLQTLNMSGSTGTNVINIARSAGNITTGVTTVTGGSGNDTVIFGSANLTNVDVIDLGAGNNTLGMVFAQGGANSVSAAQAAGLNIGTNVQNYAFTATAALTAGNSTLSTLDLGLLSNKTLVNLAGSAGVFGLTSGAAGGQALAVTGAVTGETIRIADLSGLAATAGAVGAVGGAGATGNAAADALDIASTAPFQTVNIDLTTAVTDSSAGIAITGGTAGVGGNGGNNNAGGVGGAAGIAIDGLGNITTLGISSNGSGVAAATVNSIIGGAGGNGGNGVAGNNGNDGGAGGAAAVAIDNAAGLNVNITGGFDLTIAGGAAGAAGTSVDANIVGGAGGARAYGFTSAANINATTFTGKLTIEGSNVVTAGDVISSGTGIDVINGSGGADYIDTGAGADFIEYLTGGAGEIANTAGGTQAQLGGLTDAANIESLSNFATGVDKIRINTSAAYFVNDGAAGTEQVTFTTASTATVGAVNVGNITAADVDALFAAINAAVTATASTAAVASAYLVTTGTVTGGLANSSNSTYLVINNGVAALNNLDQIVKLVGTTSVAAGDIVFDVV